MQKCGILVRTRQEAISLTQKEEFYGAHYPHMLEVERSAVQLVKKAKPKCGRIISRIKAPKSMKKKILEDGYEVNDVAIFKKESDAIGLRVIVDSTDNVYRTYKKFKKICKKESIEIDSIKDYIKRPKQNGYRSLHIVIKYPSADNTFPVMKVEIQIRTAIMDCWASLEHLVEYKQVLSVLDDETEELLLAYRKEMEQEAEKYRKK